MSALFRMFGPASGYRRDDWRLLGMMYLAGLFQGYVQTQAVNTLPFVRLAFDLSKADMSYLFAVARIGSLVAVVYAVFGDRWGRRGPFLAAYLMLMLATGATAAAFSPTVYTALQVVARMGSAAMGMLATVPAGRAGELEQPGLGDQPLFHRRGARIRGRAPRPAGRPNQRDRLAPPVRGIGGRSAHLPLVEG